MAEDTRLEVQIVLDDGSIQKGFVKLEKEAEKAADGIGNKFSAATSSFGKGLAIAAASAAAAVAGLALALRRPISEAIEAESAQTKFNLALANAGKFSEEASNSFANFTKTLEQKVAVDGDVITSNAALLVSIGNLSGEGLERATKAAIDLSKGLSIDTNSAFELVSKAASGSAGALSRYGIRIDETLPKNEQFASALGQIERRFGGLGEALAGNTLQGALDRASVSFGNLLETIGGLFTQSPVIRETVNFIAKAFDSLSKTIEGFGETDIVGEIIKRLASLAIFLTQNIAPAFEIAIRSIVTGFKTIDVALRGVIAGLAVFASAFVDFVAAPIVEFFGGTLAKIVGVFSKDVANQLTQSVQGLSSSLKQSTSELASSATSGFSDSFNELSQTADNTFNASISTSVTNFLQSYQTQIEQAKGLNKSLAESFNQTAVDAGASYITINQGFSDFISGFNAQATDFANSAQKNFAQAGRTAFTTFANGVGNAFSSVGKAIRNGQDALAAFGDALLQTIGQIAVQLGTTFIAQGIAYIFAGLPNGPALIGAGAALATIGGLLAASGGGSAGVSAAPGGGGITTTPGGGGITTEPGFAPEVTNVANQQPGNRIELNIAGDVLDSDQTGLRIVQLLNDAFDNQGTVVTA